MKQVNLTKIDIQTITTQHGFDVMGIISNPTLPEHNIKRLKQFIANNEHGTMGWMAEHIDIRCTPKKLMRDMNSIIMLGVNYAPQHQPLDWLKQKNHGAIACYALGRDYHDDLKKKLRLITRELQHQYGGDFRIFVDTAPLAEKPLAQMAGLGWQGKHSNIVSKQYGSWLLLASIITTHEFDDDTQQPHQDLCGSCTACIDICPTRAITSPYHLDARKCIAYLTIEHHGAIPVEFRKAIGNRIFGCDDCLAICPWNKFAKKSQNQAFELRKSLQNRSLAHFLTWDEPEFRKNFSKSPIKRLGFNRFIRNILIAIGNSGDKNHLPALQKWQKHDDSILSETANWATCELNQ
ncbi:MAG: tRNA epoxyqueuosine(34) reductase QueG [Alphaproteobacteria bacterium]|nr:tRNA epoxyqueuosine(34) reductase QueG [Alphaproteobacteria bacterium]